MIAHGGGGAGARLAGGVVSAGTGIIFTFDLDLTQHLQLE